jgi:hypothetical protein
MKKSIFLVLAISGLVACQPAPKQETNETTSANTDTTNVEAEEVVSEENKLAIMAEVDQYRSSIESQLDSLNKTEMSTEAARAQVAQKWSTIHFYSNEANELVRVKTYPHDGVSKRTEEFYFNGGELVNAVIEDDGSAKGKEDVFMGKMYYYKGGELIGEKNMTEESEYSIRKSDGERLLQEAKEYMNMYSSMK